MNEISFLGVVSAVLILASIGCFFKGLWEWDRYERRLEMTENDSKGLPK